MIDTNEKKNCNGCKMCKNICPKAAISYKVDELGFWYPVVDYSLCVKCKKCLNTCPQITPIKCRTKEPNVYAAWSKDSRVRLDSTSGGLFYEFATYILEHDGYVVGCVYDDDFKGAHQTIIHSKEELKPLMVSKYVQSDTEDIYIKTKEALKEGKTVLFVGNPCHNAALQAYLGIEYDNLIMCDFLCRGHNSPKAHKKYVEYLEKTYDGKMTNLRSKDKRNGWEHFGQSATFDNGKEYFLSRNEDLRIVAYHNGNLMARESCLDCKFKHIPRDAADITLGDYWGITKKEVNDIDKGISLIFTNTDKGEKLFEAIKPQIEYIDKTLESAKNGNHAIYSSATCSSNREAFLKDIDNMPFDEAVAKYRTYPYEPKGFKGFVFKVKRKCKSVIRRIIK